MVARSPFEVTPSFWKSQRVVVTGGAGFLGVSLVEQLKMLGCAEITVPRSAQYDLRKLSAIQELLRKTRPTLIIHAAATSGGIGANRKHPAEFFFDNSMMGIQLLEEARKADVAKFVQVGSVCAYPKFTAVPFQEEDLWKGFPEETNAPYGLAKKMLLVQSQAYRAQYDYNAIHLLLANLYGPRDNFDLETSHAIPALIRKCLEAKESGMPLEVWGTGEASREWLYVDDAARAILLAAEKYNEGDPINVGTGQELRMGELATLIAKLCGFTGKMVWDKTKPDGQPRRLLDTSKAEEKFGFKAEVPLEEGLRRTIDWYLKTK